MSVTRDNHAIGQTAPQDPTGRGSESMPRVVKLSLLAAMTVLLGGAVWLLTVRGEALLIDLYAAGARLLCL